MFCLHRPQPCAAAFSITVVAESKRKLRIAARVRTKDSESDACNCGLFRGRRGSSDSSFTPQNIFVARITRAIGSRVDKRSSFKSPASRNGRTATAEHIVLSPYLPWVGKVQLGKSWFFCNFQVSSFWARFKLGSAAAGKLSDFGKLELRIRARRVDRQDVSDSTAASHSVLTSWRHWTKSGSRAAGPGKWQSLNLSADYTFFFKFAVQICSSCIPIDNGNHGFNTCARRY